MTPSQVSTLTHDNRWFCHFMPYAFVRLAHSRRKHVFLPVNRKYKPLGLLSSRKVDYQDYIDGAVVFRRDPILMKDVWTSTREHLHLYSDVPRTRLDYFERLGRVLSVADSLKALESEPGKR